MNVDPLRPADTDTEHRWWVSEFEQYKEMDRRRAERRREAMWTMLTCFTLLVTIAAAAIVIHWEHGS